MQNLIEIKEKLTAETVNLQRFINKVNLRLDRAEVDEFMDIRARIVDQVQNLTGYASRLDDIISQVQGMLQCEESPSSPAS